MHAQSWLPEGTLQCWKPCLRTTTDVQKGPQHTQGMSSGHPEQGLVLLQDRRRLTSASGPADACSESVHPQAHPPHLGQASDTRSGLPGRDAIDLLFFDVQIGHIRLNIPCNAAERACALHAQPPVHALNTCHRWQGITGPECGTAGMRCACATTCPRNESGTRGRTWAAPSHAAPSQSLPGRWSSW